MAKKMKVINTVGKRKTAVSRATLREGKGIIKINKLPIENIKPEFLRLKLKEVLEIAGDLSKKVDVDINSRGGGISGQIESARQSLARALVKFSKNDKLKQAFLDYDRNLLIYDSRRTEQRKPSRSSAGARRKRQSSKR